MDLRPKTNTLFISSESNLYYVQTISYSLASYRCRHQPTPPSSSHLTTLGHHSRRGSTATDTSRSDQQVLTLLCSGALQQHLPPSPIPEQEPMHALPCHGTRRHHRVPKCQREHGGLGMYDIYANSTSDNGTKTQNRP